MKSLIYDGVYVEVPDSEEEKFKEKFTCWNPKYSMALTLGLPTKDLKPKLTCAVVYKKTYTGTVYRVPRNFSVLASIPTDEVCDSTVKSRKHPFLLTKGVKLREVQEKAINAYIEEAPKNNGTGIIALACGKGKTVLGINLIHRLQLKTLILVDQDNLAKQWQKNINDWLNGFEASLWIQGKNEIGHITIATLQSLHSHIKSGKLPKDFFSNFSLTIADECHILPADTFMTVAMEIRSKYILGLSATLVRADGLTKFINALCGPVVYQDLEADIKPTIEFHHIHQVPYSITNFIKWLNEKQDIDDKKKRMIRQRRMNKFITTLTEFEYRNKIIVKSIAECSNQGHISLVLCARREHCSVLADMLKQLGVESCVVTGEIKGKKRDAFYDQVRKKAISVIFVTTVAKKGLDIPSISAIHITYPVKTEEVVIQTIGRGCRKQDDKLDAVVHDYVDINFEDAEKYTDKRIAIYKAKGWM